MRKNILNIGCVIKMIHILSSVNKFKVMPLFHCNNELSTTCYQFSLRHAGKQRVKLNYSVSINRLADVYTWRRSYCLFSVHMIRELMRLFMDETEHQVIWMTNAITNVDQYMNAAFEKYMSQCTVYKSIVVIEVRANLCYRRAARGSNFEI